MEKEANVRKWIKQVCPNIVWTESARGGTHGQADCIAYFLPGCGLPVELKCWRLLGDGKTFAARLRREQVRFHAVMAKRREPTLILWGSPETDFVYALAGHKAPKEIRAKVLKNSAKEYPPWEKHLFINDVCSGVFWREWTQ
jgi:hypothetical protein